MAFLVEWIMDPSEYEWYYDANEKAIMATTTMVVHAHFFLGRMHGLEEPDVPSAPAIIL